MCCYCWIRLLSDWSPGITCHMSQQHDVSSWLLFHMHRTNKSMKLVWKCLDVVESSNSMLSSKIWWAFPAPVLLLPVLWTAPLPVLLVIMSNLWPQTEWTFALTHVSLDPPRTECSLFKPTLEGQLYLWLPQHHWLILPQSLHFDKTDKTSVTWLNHLLWQ